MANDYINSTITTQSDLSLFLNCFREQSCDSCLASTYPCSWCATSQVCVPNEHFRAPFAILAPIKYEDICPLAWRERWEMRAKPFSCRCSTMTLMSVVVAVVSTLAAVLLIHLMIIAIRWCSRKWKTRRQRWWRPSAYNWKPSKRTLPRWMVKRSLPASTAEGDSERQALLEST